MTPELQAIVERLETVERENRRLKRVGLVVLLVASAALLMGQARTGPRIVEAEAFVLKDSAGISRGELKADETGVRLVLYDPEKHPRVSLFVVPDGPGLMLTDVGLKPYVLLSMSHNPERKGWGLSVGDGNNHTRIALRANTEASGLFLEDANGTQRVMIGETGKDELAVLAAADGKVSWHAPQGDQH